MRKKLLIIVVIFGCLTSISLLATHHFLKEKTLSSQEVSLKWGKKEFDAQKFKKGNEQTKAEMAYSLLENKGKFKGKNSSEIRSLLGDPDGFYFIDVFPAYIIQTAHTSQEEAWQIVFILNNQRNVEDIIVHKNCCD